MNLLGTVWTDDEGQDLIEYALLAALLAVGAVAAIKIVNNGIVNAFTAVNTAISPTG
jgi:pilus assembly protein Flp/PilA